MEVQGQFDDAEVSGTCDIEIKLKPSSSAITNPDAIEMGLLDHQANQMSVRGDDGEDSEEDDEEYWGWDGEVSDFTKKFNILRGQNYQWNQNQPNAQNSSGKFQPNDKGIQRYANKITLEKYSGPQSLPDSTTNQLMKTSKKSDSDRHRVRDKADRATMEQVLDPRTRMILFKMLSRHIISEINGCISTGKEANVYHATTNHGEHRAVKVYKTSILTFKDRDRYVTGEFRFRRGYCKHNPRKMVRTWAEKEMRNLMRLHTAGVLCPQPHILRSHVLVMDFVGINGWPAPLLKDVNITENKARELYLDCIQAVRKIYQDAKLVHADLSEFNMLFCDDKLYIIDVSQSVEHDHHLAFEFLRKDCTNVTEYFRKKGVCTMTVRELFDFVTDPSINADNMDEYLQKAMEVASQRSEQEVTEQEKIDEEVFKNSFIPQKLEEVMDVEKDIKKVQTGDGDDILYGRITGLQSDAGVQENVQGEKESKKEVTFREGEILEDRESEEDEDLSHDENEMSEEDSEEDERRNDLQKYHRPKDESLSDKKERKKAVKEEKRENRKNKIPKHVKKRKEKIAKVNRTTRR